MQWDIGLEENSYFMKGSWRRGKAASTPCRKSPDRTSLELGRHTQTRNLTITLVEDPKRVFMEFTVQDKNPEQALPTISYVTLNLNNALRQNIEHHTHLQIERRRLTFASLNGNNLLNSPPTQNIPNLHPRRRLPLPTVLLGSPDRTTSVKPKTLFPACTLKCRRDPFSSLHPEVQS